MKRPEWIKSLVTKGLSQEEIFAEIKKGNEAEGIKPVEQDTFIKLIYNKIINPKPKKVKESTE